MSKMKRNPPISSAVKKLNQKLAEHEEPLPPDVEAAWKRWIAGIQGVDERAKTLLRAAFEAGAEAGKISH